MSAWVECNRCSAILPLDDHRSDSELSHYAKEQGWTIVGHFGAKRTRCPECRRRERFWQVPGSKVRHRQRRCIALIGRKRIGGAPTIWPKSFARRTRKPAVELSARDANGLRDCHYCKEVA